MPIPAPQPPRARPALPGSPPRLCPEGGDPGCACPPGQQRPLPNPAAVRLYRVPDSAPPYDEPVLARPLVTASSQPPGTASSQPPGTASRPGREAQPARTGDGGRAGRTPDTGDGGGGGHTGPPPPWPGRFAQMLAETLAGSRPARQMDRWASERARTHIRRLGAQMSAGQQPRIRRVMTSRPARDVVEMTVVVGFGPRVRALAVRLERAEAAAAPGRPARPAQWVCTAVEAA